MLGSAGFPALIVLLQVYFCPESPRWLMSKGRYKEAYESMFRIRGNELLAARDIFYIHVLLQEEEAVIKGKNLRALELFTIPRVRRATLASGIVMFGQSVIAFCRLGCMLTLSFCRQFCGVNVIAYYSSSIFVEGGLSEISALLASFGFGLINWLFAFPAVITIDKFGRRNLLLVTFVSFDIPSLPGLSLNTLSLSAFDGIVPATHGLRLLDSERSGKNWSRCARYLSICDGEFCPPRFFASKIFFFVEKRVSRSNLKLTVSSLGIFTRRGSCTFHVLS